MSLSECRLKHWIPQLDTSRTCKRHTKCTVIGCYSSIMVCMSVLIFNFITTLNNSCPDTKAWGKPYAHIPSNELEGFESLEWSVLILNLSYKYVGFRQPFFADLKKNRSCSFTSTYDYNHAHCRTYISS